MGQGAAASCCTATLLAVAPALFGTVSSELEASGVQPVEEEARHRPLAVEPRQAQWWCDGTQKQCHESNHC